MFVGYSDNAIRHLAGADHMKKVKGFLWKYGGGMDKVDTFRITEADFAKVLVIYIAFILCLTLSQIYVVWCAQAVYMLGCLSVSLSLSPNLTINYNNCTLIWNSLRSAEAFVGVEMYNKI